MPTHLLDSPPRLVNPTPALVSLLSRFITHAYALLLKKVAIGCSKMCTYLIDDEWSLVSVSAVDCTG